MKLNELNLKIEDLKKLAKKKRKKSVFLISTTKKEFKGEFYYTPQRESVKSIFCGVVVNSNGIAKKISKILDGKIDYIFVDIEKKIHNRKDKLVNIERVVKQKIQKTITKNFKPNDITVDAVVNFIQDFFRKNARGVGGKKILVAGAGNIGSKISLKLLESGSNIYLLRRNWNKLKSIVKALNIIKPQSTKSSCYPIKKKSLDFSNYDVVVGCSNNTINFQTILNKKNLPLILDVGKNVFGKKNREELSNLNHKIYRVDIENTLGSFIDSNIETEKFFNTKLYKNFKGINLIKNGVLGKEGDILVDDVEKPKKIIGIIQDDGTILTRNSKRMEKLKSKILNL